jgi:hypothetical protein
LLGRQAPAAYLETVAVGQYVISLGVVVNMNLGNGISPRNLFETMFSLTNMLVGAFLFALLFGTLAGMRRSI